MTQNIITITDKAAMQVAALIAKRGKESFGIRVGVKSGGCSGLSYTIEYADENFVPHTETFNGLTARIIQHEYDHIEGKLFIDYLKPFKRKLLQGKLADITKGKIKVDYKMVFPK